MTVTPPEAARDLRKHASAIKAALAAHTPPLPAFELDEVDFKNGPDIYAVVHLFRTALGEIRGTSSDTGVYRLYLRFVGTTVGEVQWADWVAGRALNDRELALTTASGAQQTVRLTQDPDGFAAAEQDDDGNAYVAAAQWTYAI